MCECVFSVSQERFIDGLRRLPNGQFGGSVRSPGLEETAVIYNGLPYRFIDVCGQSRSSLRRWIRPFGGAVAGVLCVTDIGAYDERRDAIAAQFAFLDTVLNAGLFPPRRDSRGYSRETPVHALLNKVDRFREALPNAPLGASCDEFAAYPEDAPAAFQPCAAFVKAAVERRLDRSKSDRACLERSTLLALFYRIPF